MKNADGEESTDVVEMDAMDVVEWEREQHTPVATAPGLAALVKQSAQTDDGSKRPPATPRPTRTGMPVPLGANPAGELPRATAPAKLLAEAAAQAEEGPSSRVPNATIPTPQPLMQQLLKSPTKHTTQRAPRLAAQTVPTPPAVQQTLVNTSEKAPAAAPPPVEAPPPGGYEELDDSWDEVPKSSTKSDAQAYSAPTTPRVTTSNTVRRGSSTSNNVVRKTGAMPAAQPPAPPRAQPKAGTVTEPLPTVAKPNGAGHANGATTAQQRPPANDQAKAAAAQPSPAATPAATATAAARGTPQAQAKPATAQQAPQAKPATVEAASTKPATPQQAKPAVADASTKPATPQQAPQAKPAIADAASARPVTAQQAKPATPQQAPQAKPAIADASAKPAQQAPQAKPAIADASTKPAQQPRAAGSDVANAKPATVQQPPAANPATAPQAKPATAQQAPQAKPATAQPSPAAKPARLATEDKPTLVVEPMAAVVPVYYAEPPLRQSEPALLPPPPIAPAASTSAPRALPLAPSARDDDWDGLAPSKPSKPSKQNPKPISQPMGDQNPKPISQPMADDYGADDFAEDREPSVIIDLNAKPVAPQDLDWGLANAALAADALGSGGTGSPMPIQTSELNTTASGIFVMPTAASPMGRSIGAKSSPAIKLPPPEDAETAAARSTVPPDDDLEVPAWTPPKSSPKTVTGAAAYAPKAGAAAAYAPNPTLADWSNDPAADAPTGNDWSGTASSAPAVINPSASAKTSTVINPSASGKTSAPTVINPSASAKTSAPTANDWSVSPGTASDAQAFPMGGAPAKPNPPTANDWGVSPGTASDAQAFPMGDAAAKRSAPAFPAPQHTAYPAAQGSATPPAKPPGVAFAFAPATQQSVQAPRAPSTAELGWEHDPAIPQALAHTEQTERRFVPRSLLGAVLPTPKAKRLALLVGGGVAGIVLVLVIMLSAGGKSTTATEKPAPVVATPSPPVPVPPKVEPPKPVEVAATDPTPPPVVEPPKVEPPKPFVRRPARPAKPLVLDYEPKPDATPVGPTPDQALARARAAYATGNQHLFAGEADAAVSAYKQALAVYPGYVAGYRGLGLAYAQSGDRAAALKAFQKYVALVPNAKDVALIQKRIARLSGQ